MLQQNRDRAIRIRAAYLNHHRFFDRAIQINSKLLDEGTKEFVLQQVAYMSHLEISNIEGDTFTKMRNQS